MRPNSAPSVIDETARLSPARRAHLTRQLDAVLRDADVEIVVLLVPALGGVPIERYAETRFEALRVGARTRGNRGALLVVAAHEQLVRLAVSYDLEPIFPDAFAGYVQTAQMRPYFQHGRLVEGIEATAELLARRALEGIAGHAYDPATVTSRPPNAPRTGGGGAQASLSAPSLRDPSRSPAVLRDAFGPQPTAEAAWMRFLELNRLRVKNPDLGLYDGAAQAHLARHPQTAAGHDHIAALYGGQRYNIRVRGERRRGLPRRSPAPPCALVFPPYAGGVATGRKNVSRHHPLVLRMSPQLRPTPSHRRSHPAGGDCPIPPGSQVAMPASCNFPKSAACTTATSAKPRSPASAIVCAPKRGDRSPCRLLALGHPSRVREDSTWRELRKCRSSRPRVRLAAAARMPDGHARVGRGSGEAQPAGVLHY